MSSTFMYFFTNAQDFWARKGPKISLPHYWKMSIYGSEVLICGWNAFEIFTKGRPHYHLYIWYPLVCVSFSFDDQLKFSSVCCFSRRIIKRYYYKNCVTRPTTDREVSSANMPGISTSFSSDSGLSRSRISSGWRLDLFGFEVSNGFNGIPLPFSINVQEKKMLTKSSFANVPYVQFV